jgi:chaperonin cofactor prefoldin
MNQDAQVDELKAALSTLAERLEALRRKNERLRQRR